MSEKRNKHNRGEEEKTPQEMRIEDVARRRQIIADPLTLTLDEIDYIFGVRDDLPDREKA